MASVKAMWICPSLAALCPVPWNCSQGAEAMASCQCSLLRHCGVSRNVNVWQRQREQSHLNLFPLERSLAGATGMFLEATGTGETEKDEILDTSAWLQAWVAAEKALYGGMKGELSPNKSHLWMQVLLGGWVGDLPPGKYLAFLKRPAARCAFPLLSCEWTNGGWMV